MYLNFFNLKVRPFKLNSDHKFLFSSDGHSQAIRNFKKLLRTDANLCVLTGEIGAGKTTVSQAFLADLDSNYRVARIHQTQLSQLEFLQMFLLEFGINCFVNSKSELLEKLTEFLLESQQTQKKVLLLVDEAQNLKVDVLKLISQLSDLKNISDRPLLKIILIGQPELATALETQELSSLSRKIDHHYHLEALQKNEVKNYIQHRLHIAGNHHEVKFSSDAIPLIYLYTGGRARLINVLLDHALLAAYVENTKKINASVIEAAIEELQWVPYGMEPTGKIFKFTESKISKSHQFSLDLYYKDEFVKEFPINKKRLHLGRHSDNDIRIVDDKVSRQHAILIFHENQFFIRDMNSKNGTIVNNKRIDMQQLEKGDTIQLGEHQLTFKSKDITGNQNTGSDSLNVYELPKQA